LARKQDSSLSLQTLARPVRAVLARLSEGDRRRWTRPCGLAILLLALSGGIASGISRLEAKVHGMERFHRRLVLEWVGLPDWLRNPDNGHILDSIVARVNLRETDRALDPGLARRIGGALLDPATGWVKSLERVRIRPDGVVEIACQFRRPAAWVHHGRYYYLVDAECYRLPGRYNPADCRGSALIVVEGVRQSPPRVGEPWPGEDLAAGMHLSMLLEDEAFRPQVDRVNVANLDGRVDRKGPHIDLATNRPGSHVWWGRAPGHERGVEITAAQKITLLQTIYRQSGRIDMHRAYVDIRIWPDRVAMPASTHRGLILGRSLRG
jgi:hypothetical protein